METINDYITTAQAAELLGITAQQVRNQIKAGQLYGIKPGHDVLVSRVSVLNRLDNPLPTGYPKGRPRKIQDLNV